MGAFKPLPFIIGNRNEQGPLQIFSAEVTAGRAKTLQAGQSNVGDALRGQFPGMSLDDQLTVKRELNQTDAYNAPEVAPVMAEVAAGATAMQTVEAPQAAAPTETSIFFAQSPEAFVMDQTVELSGEFA